MAAEHPEIRVHEAMPWLPTQILHEASNIKKQQRRYDRNPLLSSPRDFALSQNQRSKCGDVCSPIYRRQKSANWSGGGGGMQAIFLDSGGKLGGTGVFLPRGMGGGTGYQPNKKPACSMVLVPARVIQALNLDVQALGFQISPRKDPKGNQKGKEGNSIVKNKKGKNVTSTQYFSFMSHNQTNSSQEIFLPKEWTY